MRAWISFRSGIDEIRWAEYSISHKNVRPVSLVCMFGLTKAELVLLRRLDTPRKVQDYLNKLPQNFEPDGDTCFSPRRVMKEKRAHCIEGAMLAALAFRLQGHKPLILDLESARHDFDHVI